MGQVFLLYGLCFLLVLVVGSTLQSFSQLGGLVATLVFLLLVPALVFVGRKGTGLVRGLRLRRVRPSIVVSSLLLGLGTWATGMWVGRGLMDLGMQSMGQGLGVNLDSPLGFGVTLLVVAVGPGICEEVLFRGAIQGVLERRGKWFAVIVTAILFGLFHMSLEIAIPAAILGLFYGWVVVRTGSLVPGMLAHAANNAAAISFLYFLDGEDPAWLLPCFFAIGAVAFVAILRLSASSQDEIADSPMSEVPASLPLWGSIGCGAPLLATCLVAFLTASAIPYVVQTRVLPEGDSIVVAEPDSPLFEPLMQRGNARVLYTRDDLLGVGHVVEVTGDVTRIRDAEGAQFDIPTTDIEGLVLSQ